MAILMIQQVVTERVEKLLRQRQQIHQHRILVVTTKVAN